VINDFEIATAGSLEQEMLGRLSLTGQYAPGDLPRLARLMVLESIAMYENLRSDLRETMAGARLEGEMTAVWDAAELFAVSTSPPTTDLAGLARSRALLVNVAAAYRQLDATLGQLPGLSPRAAFHLRDIARLLPVIDSVFDAIEADFLRTIAPPVDRAPDAAGLRDQARRLAQDLRGLIRSVEESQPAPAGRDDLVEDLNGLLGLVQGFDRLLSAGPSGRDLMESLRLVRGRTWPVEARIVRLAGAPDLGRRWREVRQRIDALADDFGFPRVISLARPARPAKGVDRRVMAQVDRAVAALDKFLADGESSPEAIAEGSQFRGEAGELRLKLLRFRQYVAANQSTGRLSGLLRDIETANRQLSDRAGSADRIDRGGTRLDARGLRDPAQAVAKLRELLPRRAEAQP
jgi:hypothetical protein